MFPDFLDNKLQFMCGGGETGSLVRNYNWKETSLGDPHEWPECIRTAVSICLNSAFPNSVYCGDEFNLIYNDGYIQIAGNNHPDILGMPRFRAWPESWKQTQVLFEQVISSRSAVNAVDELFLLNRYGFIEQAYFNYTLSPIIDAAGKVCGIFNSLLETTDRVLAERRAALLKQFKSGSAKFDKLDSAFEEVLGPLQREGRDIPFAALYETDKQRGFRLRQVTGELITETDKLESALPEVISCGKPLFLKLENNNVFLVPVTQGGSQVIGVFVAGLNGQIYFDDNYRLFLENIGFLISTTISYSSGLEKERMVSDQIKYSEDQFQFAVDAAGLATWDFKAGSQLFTGNRRLYTWFGFPEGNGITLHQALSRIAAADRPGVEKALNDALKFETGGYYRIEYNILNPAHPEPRLVRTTGRALFNDKNEVTRFSGTLQDITAERNTLLVLEETNNRLQIALEAGSLGSYELEPKTGKMLCTAQFLANLGRPADDSFAYKDLMSQILPDYHQLVSDTIQKAIAEKQIYEIEYAVRWPDGTLHWIEAYGKPQYDNKGDILKVVGVTQDVTEHISDRKELERAYEQARLSREAAQFGTFDHDLVNGRMEWDERCRQMFGITHQRPLNMEKDLIGGMHEDDRDRMIGLIKHTLDQQKSNGDYDAEYRTIGAEDGKTRWIRAKGKVFFNEYGVPLRFIGAVLDITAQKENEIRKNDFISMVSHELKTPLTSLKAHVQVLNRKARIHNDNYTSASLDKVELQIGKMSTMINSFLSVDRLESGQIHLDKSEFLLNDLILQQIEETSIIVSSHKLFFEPCIPVKVYADFEKLGQVLTNLISNAVKYSPQGGIITIQCGLNAGQAFVSVSDTGIGISKRDIGHLFDRFYRVEGNYTKQISGFGIGLYLAAEIVRRHDGKIWVESEKGLGSTFSFSIPQSAP